MALGYSGRQDITPEMVEPLTKILLDAEKHAQSLGKDLEKATGRNYRVKAIKFAVLSQLNEDIVSVLNDHNVDMAKTFIWKYEAQQSQATTRHTGHADESGSSSSSDLSDSSSDHPTGAARSRPSVSRSANSEQERSFSGSEGEGDAPAGDGSGRPSLPRTLSSGGEGPSSASEGKGPAGAGAAAAAGSGRSRASSTETKEEEQYRLACELVETWEGDKLKNQAAYTHELEKLNYPEEPAIDPEAYFFTQSPVQKLIDFTFTALNHNDATYSATGCLEPKTKKILRDLDKLFQINRPDSGYRITLEAGSETINHTSRFKILLDLAVFSKSAPGQHIPEDEKNALFKELLEEAEVAEGSAKGSVTGGGGFREGTDMGLPLGRPAGRTELQAADPDKETDSDDDSKWPRLRTTQPSMRATVSTAPPLRPERDFSNRGTQVFAAADEDKDTELGTGTLYVAGAGAGLGAPSVPGAGLKAKSSERKGTSAAALTEGGASGIAAMPTATKARTKDPEQEYASTISQLAKQRDAARGNEVLYASLQEQIEAKIAEETERKRVLAAGTQAPAATASTKTGEWSFFGGSKSSARAPGIAASTATPAPEDGIGTSSVDTTAARPAAATAVGAGQAATGSSNKSKWSFFGFGDSKPKDKAPVASVTASPDGTGRVDADSTATPVAGVAQAAPTASTGTGSAAPDASQEPAAKPESTKKGRWSLPSFSGGSKPKDKAAVAVAAPTAATGTDSDLAAQAAATAETTTPTFTVLQLDQDFSSDDDSGQRNHTEAVTAGSSATTAGPAKEEDSTKKGRTTTAASSGMGTGGTSPSGAPSVGPLSDSHTVPTLYNAEAGIAIDSRNLSPDSIAEIGGIFAMGSSTDPAEAPIAPYLAAHVLRHGVSPGTLPLSADGDTSATATEAPQGGAAADTGSGRRSTAYSSDFDAEGDDTLKAHGHSSSNAPVGYDRQGTPDPRQPATALQPRMLALEEPDDAAKAPHNLPPASASARSGAAEAHHTADVFPATMMRPAPTASDLPGVTAPAGTPTTPTTPSKHSSRKGRPGSDKTGTAAPFAAVAAQAGAEAPPAGATGLHHTVGAFAATALAAPRLSALTAAAGDAPARDRPVTQAGGIVYADFKALPWTRGLTAASGKPGAKSDGDSEPPSGYHSE